MSNDSLERSQLDMREARTRYLSQLQIDRSLEDAGYKLNFAMTTTFSLDVDLLLACCLVLAGYDFDADGDANPVGLLRSLRKLDGEGRLLVFCEEGKERFGKWSDEIAVFLENVIMPVRIRNGCFHAKLWLLDFANEEGRHRLRLCVTSRNLTKSRDPDLWVTLDGDADEAAGTVSQNEGLVTLLDRLSDRVSARDDDARQKLVELKDRVSHCRFDTSESLLGKGSFDDYSFHLVWGEGKNADLLPESALVTEDAVFAKSIVVSPFLTEGQKSLFNRIWKRTEGDSAHRDMRLISTEYGCAQALIMKEGSSSKSSLVEELTMPLDEKAKDYEKANCRCWLPGEIGESEGDDIEPDSGELIEKADGTGDDSGEIEEDSLNHHAKAYAIARRSETREMVYELYIGSANATEAAMANNVEVLLRLQSSQDLCELLYMGMIGPLENRRYRPLERPSLEDILERNEEDVEESRREREEHNALKALAEESKARLEKNAQENAYDIVLEIGEVKSPHAKGFSIRPLMSKAKRQEVLNGAELKFEKLRLSEICDFFEVETEAEKASGKGSERRVIKIPIDYGEIAEASHDERCSHVETNVICKESGRLRQYMESFFSEYPIYGHANLFGSENGGSWAIQRFSERAWYEWLLERMIESDAQDGGERFKESIGKASEWLDKALELLGAGDEIQAGMEMQREIKTLQRLLQPFREASDIR